MFLKVTPVHSLYTVLGMPFSTCGLDFFHLSNTLQWGASGLCASDERHRIALLCGLGGRTTQRADSYRSECVH